MKKLLFLLFTLFYTVIFAQKIKAPYQIFTAEGKLVPYQVMIDVALKSDIVFFGELHNNSIAHWLELQVAKDIYKKQKNLVLGAEMFEADNQLIIDEYLAGLITTKKFEEDMRLWPNYSTDYKPLIEFAKANNLKFVATNIPRRYAGAVALGGFEALEKFSPEAKKYIAPLPVDFDSTLECYKAIIEGMGGMMMHSGINIAKAQAIKDATMAYFIKQNFPEKGIFLHFNGAYHSDNYQGIVWYLKKFLPQIKIMTISTVEQEDITALEKDNRNKADFIIVTPSDITKTY